MRINLINYSIILLIKNYIYLKENKNGKLYKLEKMFIL